MGLLDDAIREHLELKRRRGADAGEISRLESEALGPVRRSPTGVPDLSETTAAEPAAASATKDRPSRTAAERDPSPSVSTPTPVPRPAAPPPAAGESPTVVPASPSEPPPTTILRSPPSDPVELSKTPPAEAEEQAAPAPAAEEHPPSLLSRFNPARRRHTRETARDVEPAREVPPVDYDAEPPPAAHQPDVEPEGEDLLEETPEFLEETPEHDRLWFEQRPPRDFDFDG